MGYIIYDKQLEQIKASGYESRQEAISSFAEYWRHIARDDELRELIRNYNDLICEYILRTGNKAFVHSRVFF